MRIVLWLMLLMIMACSSTLKQNVEMQKDERLFRSKCIGCHSLPDVKSQSDQQWIELVESHSNKINLSKQNKKFIINFLTNHN